MLAAPGGIPARLSKTETGRVMNAPMCSIFLLLPLLAAATGLPVSFEPNKGQADARVQYLARGNGFRLFLAATEAVLSLDQQEPLRMILAGAKPVRPPRGLLRLPGKANYLIGNRQKSWQIGVPLYAKVAYERVYPGIDLVYYGGSGSLEYDFIVAPGADVGRIVLRFDGADVLRIGAEGELVVRSGASPIRWRKPLIYQNDGGRRRMVDGGYEIRGAKRVGFRVRAYDRKRPLVIDPVLMYSTYLGGSSNENSTGLSSDLRKSALTVDSSGNAYIAGNTESADFPVTGGAQASSRSGPDAFIVKLDAAGKLVFSTYLGGSGTDRAYGVAVDASGAVYVTGRTQSANFPVAGALQPALRGNEDAFIAKLAPDGASLVYSTYLGGSAEDDGHAITVDAGGNALVAGGTESLDFPLSAAFQATHGGGQVDAFVAKLNAQGNGLIFSTYLGGTNFDHPEGIAVDSSANVWVAGYTGSGDFPTAGAIQPALRGRINGFVIKFDAQGRSLISTYLGGSDADLIFGVAVDGAGNAYVGGGTSSADFPATRGAFQERLAGGVDGFVAKISAAGSLVYATYLGGATDTEEDMVLAIAVNASGSAFVTGTTTSSSFPIMNAFQPLMGGVRDVFLTALSDDGNALLHSSFFGGSGLDYGYGIALDGAGNVFITGRTFSMDLPVPAAVQPELSGQSDAFVAKIASQSPAGLIRAVHAASFRPGGALAPGSIASAFGTDLAPVVEAAASMPLPRFLAGIELRVKDNSGNEQPAPLFFVSPSQINFLVPDTTAAGPAILTVVRGGRSIGTAEVRIEPVAPGVFTANADGRGVPAAIATRTAPDGTQSRQLVFDCAAGPGSCKPIPIDVGGPGDEVVLTLFATGIRGRTSLGAIQATVISPPLDVLYAGPQGEFVGLDQINIRLPRDPFVRDVQELRLLIDGRLANPVVIHLK